MIYFTAHTFKCVCHCRRAMFRVLGMYNFACIIFKNKIFFHPAKFDNFKDETISDYKTVSVPNRKKLAGLNIGGLVEL